MAIKDRSYSDCALLDDISPKTKAVLGSTEKKQWIFGSNQTISAGGVKALTFSGLTGGLITTVDHSVILAQKLNGAPSSRTRIEVKGSSGFQLAGDTSATYSIIIIATAPSVSRFRSTPKWAKDYCPGCKEKGMWANSGSIYKDISLFSGRVQNGAGGTLAVKLSDLTLPSEGVRKSGATMMENTDYQIIIFPSSSAAAVAPYPSSITEFGFTLNGDANEYFNILILGQVRW